MQFIKESSAKYIAGLRESSVYQGDCETLLKKLPSNFFRCCITSPPYWGLRDYGDQNQIGAEETLSDYIHRLANIFDEVARVLTPDGTCWLNLGDSYTSGNRGYRAPDRKNPVRAMSYRARTPEGLKEKDLIGVPWRLALALQERGWFLRSDIIWEKPNCMPESVKDRPTRSHEYLFLLSKSAQYYYDRDAVKEVNGRNRRSVWSIPTEPYRGAHFATFPAALIEPCVLAGSRPKEWILDPFFGSGTTGVVCEKHGRRYVGVELVDDYVKLAINRIRQTERSLFSSSEGVA